MMNSTWMMRGRKCSSGMIALLICCCSGLSACSSQGNQTAAPVMGLATGTPVVEAIPSETPTRPTQTTIPTPGPEILFTDLNLADTNDEMVLLFIEKGGEPAYPMQISMMRANGDYLGPLIKFSNDDPMRYSATPDGSFIAAVTEERLFLFDMLKKEVKEIHIPPISHRGDGIAISPDGNTLVTCGMDLYVSEEPFTSWRLALDHGDTNGYILPAFSPDGKRLFSVIPGFGQGENPGTGIYLTDTACLKGQEECSPYTDYFFQLDGLPFQADSVSWSSDSYNFMIVFSSSSVFVFNVDYKDHINDFQIPQAEDTFDLHKVSWSPDGLLVAYQFEDDIYIYRIDAKSHVKIRDHVQQLLFWVQG